MRSQGEESRPVTSLTILSSAQAETDIRASRSSRLIKVLKAGTFL
jgi:hypothetical protein